MTHIFELDVPTPQEIIKNQNGIQHLKKGTTPKEIKNREYKFTFSRAFLDGILLHNTINTAIEPCKNGDKTYAEFFTHKVNIKTGLNTWLFVFHQPNPSTSNPGQSFVGEIKIPGGKNQKEIIIIFFKAKFINILYPIGMLFNASHSQVRLLNPTWNEAVLKQKHIKN